VDYFEKDGLVRNAQGIPLGRIVLAEPYVKGEDISVATLTVPLNQSESLLGSMYYIDGQPYKLPDDLPTVKLSKYRNRWVADSFILKKVHSDTAR
jgi:hypothetical protein